jgi:hypothetical protein
MRHRNLLTINDIATGKAFMGGYLMQYQLMAIKVQVDPVRGLSPALTPQHLLVKPQCSP